ncbi:hypothetical protein [Methylocapsa palsarum]|uniref:Uncharacterized protein n=1 Tax=Methylocapsa palsarum TaxID=1612308 RepID=A0A1I3YTC0_9HYPH|nr:hypothetical protein [Methylocapsa palsarum]SFK34599.1 hypothetical protein SAMN05444581_106141 [Methylocapsa palsarum]
MTANDIGNDIVDEQQAKTERSRLVDHFKRVYSIIAGLAITEACKNLWPFSPASIGDYRLWMFAAFFITIVPIFHGGDRSLDRKYIDHKPESGWQRASYIWDVYMLLITAIFFVGLAEAIPKTPTPAPKPPELAYFYDFMAMLFLFDAGVLWVDYAKSNVDRRRKLANSYKKWIPINLILCIFCAGAAYVIDPTGPVAGFFGMSPSTPIAVSIVVFLAAAARTFADYWFGDDFMFP